MNCRERLLAVYEGNKPDRTPITMFITDTDIEDGPPDCVLGQRGDDTIGELIRFHEILGIDIMLRVSTPVFEPIAFNIDTENWTNNWQLKQDGKHLIHTILTPAGELRETFNLEGEEFHGGYSEDWMKLRNIRIEPLIKTEQDIQIIKKHRPATPTYDLSHIRAIKQRLGPRGIILPRVPSSVFNYAVGLMKLEDLLVAPILKPDFYKEIMALCENDVIAVGVEIARADSDVVRVVGNIANSGMVSPDFYREHIYPYEKRYVDALAAEGCNVLFHNCGRCASLLPVYREMLPGQALESLSTPATGGDISDLKTARQALGDNVVMVGNFDQVQLLRNGTPGQIREQVRKTLDETAGDTRFIFSTSDSIIPGTPGENVHALAEAALEYANR